MSAIDDFIHAGKSAIRSYAIDRESERKCNELFSQFDAEYAAMKAEMKSEAENFFLILEEKNTELAALRAENERLTKAVEEAKSLIRKHTSDNESSKWLARQPTKEQE